MRISDWSSDVCSSDLKAYIDGAGTMLRNAPADDYSFLGLMREIHLTLVAGTVGHWILAVSGVLLFTNMSFGLILAWQKRGQWRHALRPRGRPGSTAGYYSWHQALGRWAGTTGRAPSREKVLW